MSVRLEVEGGIGTIILDSPPVNALDRADQLLLGELAEAVMDDEDIRAVLIRGAGGVFSAGADIAEMARLSPAAMREHAPRLQGAFGMVAAIQKPVCAAIEGFALGGGLELACAADFRVCGEGARLAMPEIRLGVIPGAGGTQYLPRLVGLARAKWAVMTGDDFNLADVVNIGLVNRVVPPGEAVEAASKFLAWIANGSGTALAAAKRSIDFGYLTEGFEVETERFAALFGSPDQREGMAAFLEKRAPEFNRPAGEEIA